ncbi:MAG: hypothetical protein Q8K36_05275 [Alphaproteobacteria bacterium]|nr:hypothetical protein [Alphaproteobacteria bacterium]
MNKYFAFPLLSLCCIQLYAGQGKSVEDNTGNSERIENITPVPDAVKIEDSKLAAQAQNDDYDRAGPLLTQFIKTMWAHDRKQRQTWRDHTFGPEPKKRPASAHTEPQKKPKVKEPLFQANQLNR